MTKEEIQNKTVDECTHKLICKHCIGSHCSEYYMKCLILSTTKSGNVKVLVFGERNWRGKDHIKNIRYVHESRIIKNE